MQGQSLEEQIILIQKNNKESRILIYDLTIKRPPVTPNIKLSVFLLSQGSCEQLFYWWPYDWEVLGAGGEEDNRGWDGWMASLTRLTWVWVNSWSWWWTGGTGVLRFMGLQRVGHNWATKVNWTDDHETILYPCLLSFLTWRIKILW